LLQRPGFSIKARLTILFSVAFFVTAGVCATTYYILSRIVHGVQLVAVTESFTHEAQEARRTEKNYFLYQSDPSQVIGHLDKADEMLGRAARDIRPIVGADELVTLRGELARYRELIEVLLSRTPDPAFRNSSEYSRIEAEIRDHGAEMVARAFAINEAERREILEALSLAKRIAVILFLVLLAFCVYIGVHIYRHILARLARLTSATQDFAAGRFTPTTPIRRYKDEFSYLAIALNHMRYELERRHRILIESHKMRAVGNLTAGIAHELNNPLNNIMLTSEMLKEDWHRLGDEMKLEMVGELTEQAERARTIVKNLLDFARESEAKVELLSVDAIVSEVVRLGSNQIRINRIRLHTDVARNLPSLHGDRNLLVQALLNLILNAIDAMPGGGQLTIRAEQSRDTGFLALHLQDTGIGIPPHLLRVIFDPFFTTKPTGKGTGLGLSVSRGILLQHGGDISVTSQPGAGTTFTVHLPFVPVPAPLPRNPNTLSHAMQDPPVEGPTQG
jgi:signal transduction histidine kinase